MPDSPDTLLREAESAKKKVADSEVSVYVSTGLTRTQLCGLVSLLALLFMMLSLTC